MIKTTTRLGSFLCLVLAACTGGSGTGNDAAPQTDASMAADATDVPDAMLTPDATVGPDTMPTSDAMLTADTMPASDAMLAADTMPTPDATTPVDAMVPLTPNLACASVALPTTATDPATVTGRVIGSGASPIAGATLQYRLRSDDSVVATATSAANGSYVLTVPTGGVPVDGYFVITATGYPTSYRYFGYPLSGDMMSDQQINTEADLNAQAATGGITIDWTRGNAIVTPLDCDQLPVRGAVVIIAGGGADVATTGSGPGMCDTLASSATMTTGCPMFEFGIGLGTTKVDTTYSGMLFLTQQFVKMAANSVTYVLIQPARP